MTAAANSGRVRDDAPTLLASTLSAACAIHCAATAVIAPWAPTAAALAGGSRIEGLLIAVAAVSAAWLLARTSAPVALWLAVALALGVAAVGRLLDWEAAQQAGLIGSSAAQIICVFKSRRRRRGDCCETSSCGVARPIDISREGGAGLGG